MKILANLMIFSLVATCAVAQEPPEHNHYPAHFYATMVDFEHLIETEEVGRLQIMLGHRIKSELQGPVLLLLEAGDSPNHQALSVFRDNWSSEMPGYPSEDRFVVLSLSWESLKAIPTQLLAEGIGKDQSGWDAPERGFLLTVLGEITEDPGEETWLGSNDSLTQIDLESLQLAIANAIGENPELLESVDQFFWTTVE